MRVGIGYDVHRFREDGVGVLRLGGVEVADAPQLDGHSDGDALIHALIDALLGAAGEGDIGKHFPPGDPATKNIDSRELLKRVQRLVASRGYSVTNVDATVVAERPRLAAHIDRMRESIAAILGVGVGAVSVKATTNERLGEIGAGLAIAVTAVALLDQDVP
ncbi:MAG: 2-C-methyl-D-erythritol 2,4-cyclodiphosphate synthase [Chloroflexi bacterium]|nr:2-C-methyl-D-erythritol 2,4-cyclodiphosphate synthase [Chloroflexota bacterium]MDA1241145.1 2-C-methyl-D-erythritol 2,4-cyclodiphosphate synthase [Chloroflexota bacterium]MQC19320.1 2-C-methyl-D-erythritol 2,4-cyclodiphosphate synthase [Chloroflexota bacterium]